MVMSVVVPPERNKKKNVLVNTFHCRAEIDTVQYVVNKFGYREAADRDEGNLIWYGIALRDGDIDWLKTRVCMLNRYPLMDVSSYNYNTILAFCKKEHLLRHRVTTLTLLPARVQIHARLISLT
jgi:hypothetical protein